MLISLYIGQVKSEIYLTTLSVHFQYHFVSKSVGFRYGTSGRTNVNFPVYVIIIIISGSTVLVRTLTASHRRFRNLIKLLVKNLLD
jgi:hypothetical protein